VRRLREVVREEDLVGRLGGEEFLLIARETGADDLQRLAERLRDAVGATPMACGGAQRRQGGGPRCVRGAVGPDADGPGRRPWRAGPGAGRSGD
jgi:GGDEF domain-containing protein